MIIEDPESYMSFYEFEEFAEYLHLAAHCYGCQFVIASNSPVLICIDGAICYDLDRRLIIPYKWSEMPLAKEIEKYFEYASYFSDRKNKGV